MVQRLAMVCAVELVLALLLAFALSASPRAHGSVGPAAPADVPPTPIDSTPDANTNAAGGSRARTPAERGATDATVRESATTGGGNAAARTVVAPKVRPDDPVGVLRTGTVRWRDGGPVKEPRVYASAGKEQRGAETAADGSFALSRLQPGEWTVRLGADGAVDSTVTTQRTIVRTREGTVLDLP